MSLMLSLISVQSRENRIATITKSDMFVKNTWESMRKVDYHLRLKEIKWHNGFFGAHIIRASVTTRKNAFALARKWVDEGKY